MRNRFIRDKKDMRNPYGSRGGYVSSRRGRDYGMPSRMGSRERDYRMGSEYMSDYSRGYSSMEQPRQYDRTMGSPMSNVRYDYNYPYMPYDMRYDYSSGYAMSEDDYEDLLKDKCKELKKYDKFNMSKEDVLAQARQMGFSFKDYDEEEFIVTYYMLMSDYKADMLNNPQIYMIMAKEWLEDDDSELQGGEKLYAYLTMIVEGKALDCMK